MLRRPLLTIVSLVALLALPASAHAAGATIGAVDCAAGGAVATLTNSGSAPVTYVVLRDERAVANVVVPPGPPVTRIVPLAEGAAAQVTVRYGSSYVSSYVRRQCASTPVDAASAANAATAIENAPLESAPVVPGTGVQPAAERTPAPAQEPDALTLPDPTTTWPLLAVAAIALVLALAMALGRVRRRPQERDARRAPAARPRA